METYSVWMKIPATNPDRPGFSRIAQGLSEEQAKVLAEALNFEGRAMPDSNNFEEN